MNGIQKELACIMVTWKSGDITRLYGYPVHRDGVTIGIVCGDSKHAWEGYKLNNGHVVEYHNYRSRKEALAAIEEV